MIILGIDPGAHGGFCFMNTRRGYDIDFYSYNKLTPHDIARKLQCEIDMCYALDDELTAYIEEVHSMPRDGKASAFSFGKNYGMWLGMLTALHIPYTQVLPAKWQAGLKLRVRGLEYADKKRALKAEAQKRFPKQNITLETCDAVLIAEYGRQITLKQSTY